jgi:hypothetical protein
LPPSEVEIFSMKRKGKYNSLWFVVYGLWLFASPGTR